MTSQITPIGFETINLEANSNGIKTIKLVKLPDERLILDIMFSTGLRITIDIVKNMDSGEIERQLKLEIIEYRNSSVKEYEIAVIAISNLLATITESDGIITQIWFDYESKKRIQDCWSESLFLSWMKNNNFTERYQFELVNEVINELYTVST